MLALRTSMLRSAAHIVARSGSSLTASTSRQCTIPCWTALCQLIKHLDAPVTFCHGNPAPARKAVTTDMMSRGLNLPAVCHRNRGPAFAPHSQRCRGLCITRAQQTQEKQNTTPDFQEDEIIFKPLKEVPCRTSQLARAISSSNRL